ncbi:MAG: TAT-variant-translocated molybdopterin oxidoreductase [Bdellovibrionia bacterium]
MSAEKTPTIWRSLQELEGDPSFQKKLEQEFPAGASVWNELDNPLSRRSFLQIMGASVALAGITACTKMPPEKIIPYVVAPENLIPGFPQTYASTLTLSGYAKGVWVQSHEGRPTKIEGNPLHPASLGSSDIFMQAELLQLYDPERSKGVLHLGEVSTWDSFLSQMKSELSDWETTRGAGVRILSETITSPTLLADIDAFLRRYPKAQWHSYDPINQDFVSEATLQSFGRGLLPVYDFSKAAVVLSLDSDFLGPGPAQQAYSRAFMSRRGASGISNRLYVIESSLTLTGAKADHRLPARSSQTLALALMLAQELGLSGLPQAKGLSTDQQKWIREAAKDLRAHAGASLIVAGELQSSEVQSVAIAINDHLKNFGSSISWIAPPATGSSHQLRSLNALTQDMQQGKVTALLIFGANPVYQAPGSLAFGEALKKVPLRIRHGLYHDETSYLCHWHLPESHALEAWGDARAYDGSVSFQQPLISPLYDTRSGSEVFSILLNQPGRTSYQALKAYWADQLDGVPFESCIHDGILKKSASPRVQAKLSSRWKEKLPAEAHPISQSPLEAVIRPDSTVWDGRYANNAWLQELPKPLLQLTWDNAILISPDTASKLQLSDEDEVELSAEGRTIRGAVLRVPGHPNDSLTLSLGYGRNRAGKVGNDRGYNAFLIQNHQSPYFLPTIDVKKTGRKYPLATIHDHQTMAGRDIVVRADLTEFQKKGEKIIPEQSRHLEHPSLIPEYPYKENAWAMVINLTTCIGCKACTIACQAENNIPVVGKEQVRNGREMHWIRVDRYFEGTSSAPRVYFQPVPCMHCEKAPCEYVCPTAATVHSTDGLNQMVYNRCVGTRYCSNNCPYKVRRFNFFQYADTKSKSIQLMYNPDVTVRSRGVMEKCTYCIQRIQEVRITAEKENRPIRDGEVITACSQACPTEAIIFGDKNDKSSRVAKLRENKAHYFLLAELGTQPRTSYLASIRNPNLALQEEI